MTPGLEGIAFSDTIQEAWDQVRYSHYKKLAYIPMMHKCIVGMQRVKLPVTEAWERGC